MAKPISLTINGRPLCVQPGTSVAAAILTARAASRLSPTGHLRAPFCGMGICMECRATVNGVPQQPTCQMLCEPGMEVVTA
jgi:D-hydroxyproline dehydrogenase subunit gamma